MAELPLIQRSLIEHEALIAEAGVPRAVAQDRLDQAVSLARRRWPSALRDLERARQYGVDRRDSRCQGIAAREPHLTGDFAGAIHFPAPGFVPDPGGLAKAYAALFGRKGGRFLVGDARTLEQSGTRMAHRRPTRARSSRAKSWWRWGHGRIWCSVRSAIRSRSASSAAIICI